VKGAFNAGATMHGDEVILLLRVAESCRKEHGVFSVPVYSFVGDKGELAIQKFLLDDPDVKTKDTRGLTYRGDEYLSTLSTLRVARSNDGVNFTVDDQPLIYPSLPSERYGCEDARIQRMGDDYFISYTAVSPDGWATSLCVTRDFASIERKGIIFCPQNKDVCIFPEKIAGRYWALHRPNNEGFGRPSIWISSSPNMLDWGDHRCLIRPRDSLWESVKIGGGAPPIRTDKGWLEVYHGKGEGSVYSLFTLLLDLDDPSRVVARGESPILVPETDYEKKGFFPNVVFSNGLVVHPNGEIYLYYGACDETTNLALTSVNELLSSLTADNAGTGA
jgi:predicted GH43/DUF377 family glycosyl hydrolase